MAFVLTTPRKRKTFVVFTHLLILTQPVFSFCFYLWNESVGAYPSDADSIAIPIFSEWIAWLVWAPLVLLFLRRTVLKHYPGPVPIFAWNKERQAWSFLWTLLFAALLIVPMSNLPYDFALRNPFGVLDTILWTIFYVFLRAIIVFEPSLMVLKINRKTTLSAA